VLGVDSSAHSTTVELRDSDTGKVFGSGRAPHPPAMPPRAEQDPMTWWQALVEARHDAGGALGVAAVAVAAQGQGLITLDQQAHVVRPAKLASDTEARHDAESLVEALGGPAEWVHACGSVPDASFTIAKLAWLRRTEPEAYDRTVKVLLPHDWLTFRLSRQVVTDRGDASGTGYWSPREERWRPDVLTLVDSDRDWGACLPRVLGPAEPAGDREGVLIAGGTGSAMAVALGLALKPRDVVIDVGDTVSVFTVRERPTEDATGAVIGFADATGRHLPLVRGASGMRTIEAFARLFDIDKRRIDQLAGNAPTGAGGMVLVPATRRSRASLHGIPDDLSPELFARAVVESVVVSIIDALDALRAADVPVGGRMFLVGDGAKGHALQQTLADLTERPVAVPQGDRVVAGACVQAASALDGSSPEAVAAGWGLDRAREVEPDPRVDREELRAAIRAARSPRG
jgi:xylulokinase